MGHLPLAHRSEACGLALTRIPRVVCAGRVEDEPAPRVLRQTSPRDRRCAGANPIAKSTKLVRTDSVRVEFADDDGGGGGGDVPRQVQPNGGLKQRTQRRFELESHSFSG
eukprot:3372784-Rhodomonas_salina.6